MGRRSGDDFLVSAKLTAPHGIYRLIRVERDCTRHQRISKVEREVDEQSESEIRHRQESCRNGVKSVKWSELLCARRRSMAALGGNGRG